MQKETEGAPKLGDRRRHQAAGGGENGPGEQVLGGGISMLASLVVREPGDGFAGLSDSSSFCHVLLSAAGVGCFDSRSWFDVPSDTELAALLLQNRKGGQSVDSGAHDSGQPEISLGSTRLAALAVACLHGRCGSVSMGLSSQASSCC